MMRAVAAILLMAVGLLAILMGSFTTMYWLIPVGAGLWAMLPLVDAVPECKRRFQSCEPTFPMGQAAADRYRAQYIAGEIDVYEFEAALDTVVRYNTQTRPGAPRPSDRVAYSRALSADLWEIDSRRLLLAQARVARTDADRYALLRKACGRG